MYYEDEDFYEPSEFEQQFEEFRETLRKSVKKEIEDELQRLRKENEQLNGAKDNLVRIEREHQQKLRELEKEKQTARFNAKSDRLNELISSVCPIMYKANLNFEQGPKCDKCNASRQVFYKTPLGRDATEYCRCADYIKTWIPEPQIAYEMKINRYGNQQPPMSVWYRAERSMSNDEGYVSTTYFDKEYKAGDSFEGLDTYKTLFRDLNECQAFCDWLNINKK